MSDNMPTQDENSVEQAADQPVRIPVDTPPPSPRGEHAPDVDDLVRDYERKYKGFREGESPSVRESLRSYLPPKWKRIEPMRTGATTENERMWAALAHASAILTVLLGIPSAGVTVLLTLFIPLMIYLYYRDKSEYVAYHALQAFALQVLGTIGFVAIFVIGTLAAVLISVVLLITIIGLLVVPFVALAWIVFAVACFGLPLGMLVFGLIAAWEAYQGNWYRYPYIGLWLERQMHGGFLRHV